MMASADPENLAIRDTGEISIALHKHGTQDQAEGRLEADLSAARARTIVLSTGETPLPAARQASLTPLAAAETGRSEVRAGV